MLVCYFRLGFRIFRCDITQYTMLLWLHTYKYMNNFLISSCRCFVKAPRVADVCDIFISFKSCNVFSFILLLWYHSRRILHIHAHEPLPYGLCKAVLWVGPNSLSSFECDRVAWVSVRGKKQLYFYWYYLILHAPPRSIYHQCARAVYADTIHDGWWW